MLRVVDLMALPVFEKFKLVSNADGLYNRIEGVSILDWESPKNIEETFRKKDFVFVTMYMNNDNDDLAHRELETLIKMRVGAIAIKVTESFTCEDRIVEMANQYRIPIFTYEKEYLEDLVYIVRSAILSRDANNVAHKRLIELMNSSTSEVVACTQKLSPDFKNEHVCICCIPDDKVKGEYSEEVFEEILDDSLKCYKRMRSQDLPGTGSGNIFIRCEKCLVVFHCGGDKEYDKAQYMKLLQNLGVETQNYAIGVSGYKSSLLSVKEALDEAIVGAVEASIYNEDIILYKEVGINRFILSSIRSKICEDFYQKCLTVLQDYDTKHNTELLATLIAYIESEEDIALTAKKMYQHGNTIRYRINKVHQIMKLDDNIDGKMQIFVFARIHRIRCLIGGDALI